MSTGNLQDCFCICRSFRPSRCIDIVSMFVSKATEETRNLVRSASTGNGSGTRSSSSTEVHESGKQSANRLQS